MKSLFSILIVLLFPSFLNAQITAIPDSNFEQALIDLGHDNIIDGQVLTANINTVSYLNVSSKNISDLTGISAFTSLSFIYVDNNLLTTLDLSNNLSLSIIGCDDNQLTSLIIPPSIDLYQLTCMNNFLTSLDITQNPNLQLLQFNNNLISSIDVTQNPVLETFNGPLNQLTTLDLSQNPLARFISVNDNQLNCLNVKSGNNSNVIGFLFRTGNNPNLTCIEVDDAAYSTNNWTNIDAQTSFSTNCGNLCSVVTGIKEGSFSSISFHPNPTAGNVTIDLGETLYNIKATLTNSLGQAILSENFTSTNFINLDIDAPNGIYFLKLDSANGETKTIKVLKE